VSPSPTLSPPARLGTQLAVGALVLLLAAWLFGAIADEVFDGTRMSSFDAEIAQWLHRRTEVPVTRALLVVTNLHSTVAIAGYAALAALWFAWRRRWRELATVVVAIGGGLLLNVLMKHAFQRARPTFDEPLLTLASYSFPSGHVAASTVFYGVVIAWTFARTSRSLWRALAVGGALAMIALVAFTRMYLGLHYLSDVAAAFAEGVAWLAICLSALAAYGHRARAAP
jgi:membrane-associated phospholipid phosphatase